MKHYLFNGNGFPTSVTTIDNISGITPAMLYQQLTPEINSISKLRNKLVSAYPVYNNNSFNQLFNVYGY